jgi:hypothetical protein
MRQHSALPLERTAPTRAVEGLGADFAAAPSPVARPVGQRAAHGTDSGSARYCAFDPSLSLRMGGFATTCPVRTDGLARMGGRLNARCRGCRGSARARGRLPRNPGIPRRESARAISPPPTLVSDLTRSRWRSQCARTTVDVRPNTREWWVLRAPARGPTRYARNTHGYPQQNVRSRPST